MPDPFKIEWAPFAQTDLDEILEYIALRDGVDVAMKVCEKLLDQVESLTVCSERCRVPPELKRVGVFEYRELIVAPYSIFFRMRGKKLSVVAVLDRRRDLEELLIKRSLRS
ncbi:MAG: type II toxin-antitoxin system RelE/ParE family toxin [Pontiellaceae bacterium]|nr:type II toxin-antitoxin system RelE/ParE family toxin [Pontiellaceae bacterium]